MTFPLVRRLPHLSVFDFFNHFRAQSVVSLSDHFAGRVAFVQADGGAYSGGAVFQHALPPLALDDGRIVEVIAADESLHEVRAANVTQLARIAYHVGNRHVPLQVEDDHLLMLPDHVLRAMVEGLGGTVSEVRRGFQPESGAYGHSHVHHSHDDEGHGGRIHDGLSPRTQDR